MFPNTSVSKHTYIRKTAVGLRMEAAEAHRVWRCHMGNCTQYL